MHGITSAQSFNIKWQNCYGGSKWEKARDIIKIDDGYLIICNTRSDDGDISHAYGLVDMWIVKISNTGDLLWKKTYGGSNGDDGVRIFEAGEGNFYIIGGSNSSDGDISYDPYPDSWDLWVLKIDSVGNIIWEEIYGGNGDETVWTGTTTDDGGLVALVWTGSSDGDVSNHYGYYDAWMIKVNSKGEKQWDFTLGSPGQDAGQAIIQTSDGGFLVGVSTILFEGGNITCTPHNRDYVEAVLVKLDADLNIEWNRCYGGSNDDLITGLLELNDGYLMGANSRSNDGDVSGNHGSADHWIVKIDFDGNILWQKCLGGTGSEGYTRIYNADDNFIVTGTTSSYNGDVTGNNSISEDYRDIWIVNLDSDGEILWQQCFGGIANEELYFGFHYISENNFVIAGQTDNGPSFDVGCTPHGGNGDRDFWVFEVKDTTVNVQEQLPATTGISAYPNPAKDYVCFGRKDKENSRHLEISIYSASGIPVKELTLYPGETIKVWDTRSIRAGVYFYRSLRQDGTAEYGKIVLE